MSPTRSLMAVLVLALLALVSPLRAEDDDPSLRGKKLSEWIDLLQNGKNVDERRAGLLAVKLIGPRKSRKVVPALIAAVRENSEVKIRAAPPSPWATSPPRPARTMTSPSTKSATRWRRRCAPTSPVRVREASARRWAT